MVPSEFLENFQKKWNELLNSDEGEKVKLNMLKLVEVGKKGLSVKKKRYAIGTNPERYLEEIINL